MIDKRLAGEVLAKAVSGGADFAEIFCELTRTNTISLLDKKTDKIRNFAFVFIPKTGFLLKTTI